MLQVGSKLIDRLQVRSADANAHIGAHTGLKHHQPGFDRVQFRRRSDARQVGCVQNLGPDVIRTLDMIAPLSVIASAAVGDQVSVVISYELPVFYFERTRRPRSSVLYSL
jgi:hypothetical protein